MSENREIGKKASIRVCSDGDRKKKCKMDLQIYLQFSCRQNGRIENRWIVIEDRDGEEEEEGSVGWVLKSEKERVRQLHLPQLPYHLKEHSLVVNDSSLILVGGVYRTEDGENDDFDGFHVLDMLSWPPCWSRVRYNFKRPEEFIFLKEAAVSKAGDLYVVGNRAARIRYWSHDFSRVPSKCSKFILESRCDCPPAMCEEVLPWCNWEFFPPLPASADLARADLLALTETKLFLFCPIFGSMYGELVCGDLRSRDWEILHDRVYCSKWSTGVVLRDSYLISFGVWDPNSKEYRPALYIFDISRREWLSKPVQGLPNDGIVLPLTEVSFRQSLMQVRRHELKFALVWVHEVTSNPRQTQVHWSKFTLHTNNNQDSSDAPLYAQLLSSGICLGGDTCLINSTVGHV